MQNNWTLISFGTGLFGGLLSYLIVKDWRVCLLVVIIITIIMLINNPKKRYIRAFYIVLSMFFVLNRLFFKIIGSISNVDFVFGSNEMHWAVSCGLIFLSVTLAKLDHMERNGIKQSFSNFISIRINSPNIGENGISQGANSIINQVIVRGDYIESGSKRINLNQIDEVEKLINREEELVDLINNLPQEESIKIEKHKNELQDLREETTNLKITISELADKINLMRISQPIEIKKVSEELFHGHFGSAKDMLFEIQKERGDRGIAENLGITYEEFIELDYEILDGHTSSDGMIYYYIINFSENSPINIIEKIQGIKKGFDGYELEVSPVFFDDGSDFE